MSSHVWWLHVMLAALALTACGAHPARTASDTDCAVAYQERASGVASLTYGQFNGANKEGWRELERLRCYVEAARLLDDYRRTTTVSAGQAATIDFHRGQVLAFADKPGDALAAFQASLLPDGPIAPDGFDWNSYVRGTIAFFEGNAAELRRAEHRLSSSSHPNNRQNARFLRGLLSGLGESYRAAYRPLD